MPIFISKFSPDRAAAGNFLFARPPEKAEEAQETAGRKKKERVTPAPADERRPDQATRGEDRLDLRATERTAEEKEAAAPRQQDTATAAPVADPLTRGLRSLMRGLRDTFRPEARTLAAETQAREPVLSTEPEATRLAVPASTPPAVGNLRVAVEAAEEQNEEAVRSVVPERLEALAEFVQSRVAEPDESPADGVAAEPLEQAEEAPLAAAPVEGQALAAQLPEPAPQGISALAAPPPDLPPREDQEQRLQKDVQTIASGLRNDAAIESQINSEKTSRGIEEAAERSQRGEMRDNQAEILSLQAERRQLQQDLQQRDQAIRQLQGRNSRLQARGRPQPSSGTTLDIVQ